MTSVVASLDTTVDPQVAWAAITDWAGQSRWMPMTRVDVVSGDGALGTRLTARTGVGPIAFVDDMEIDVWEPPRRCEVRHRGRMVRGRGVFTVDPVDGGARVTWEEDLTGIAARLSAPLGRAVLRIALRRFVRRLS